MPALRTRLGARLVAAVVGTALLAGSAVGSVAVFQARSALREDIQSSSLAAAKLAADQTSSYVSEASSRVVLLASRSDIRSAVERRDWEALQPELKQWAAMNPRNDGVALFEPDGTVRVLAMNNGGVRPDSGSGSVTQRDWFGAVMATGRPSMGEPTASRGTGRPVVPFGVPVYDRQGELRAIIVAPISLEGLSAMVQKVRGDDDAYAAIDDLQRELVLADADFKHLLQPISTTFDTSTILSRTQPSVFESTLPDGTNVLAAFAPVPDLRWGVRVYQSTSSVFAPLNDMIAKTVALIGLTLVLAASFALGLGMWITRPLSRLRTAARAMADGDLSRRANLTRTDEIGDLGSAFDAMADQLASHVTRLEEDVRERKRIERELREGQARLRAFFDAAPIGINVLDANARSIQANKALQEMIGYTEEELIGRTFADYSHPDELGRDAVAIREMRAGGTDEIVRREKAYRHKDGHKVWVQITAASPRDESGKPMFFVAMCENLSDRKHAEAALAESEQRNRAILKAALDGILTIDPAGRVSGVNPAAETMFERTDHDSTGRHISELIELDAATSWHDPDALVGKRIEGTLLRRGGDRLPVELAIAGYELRERCEFTIYVRDITMRRQAEEERRQAEERLTQQALYDALTSLPNRTLLNDRLQQAITAARRSKQPLGLLLLDLDRFKDVNDTLGHHAGDELLQQVGARLQQVLRASDTVGRLGGDEFAIVLPGIADATAMANKVLSMLESPFTIEGHSVAIGASIGVAVFPDHGDDATSLLRRADVAMYNAKRTRGGFTLYSAEQDQHNVERLALLAELRDGIGRDQLVLHYQPKVALGTGEVIGVEALVRWQHPRRGLLGPDQFIPVAEQSGLIRPLTSWVLREALGQVRQWRDAGSVVPVAVNLSPHSLQEHDLCTEITALLAELAIDPSLLEVEITESAYMSRPQAVIASLEQLRSIGVKVAIDDFGTGYSSLSYLMQLPVDEVKIDRSFVRGMAEHERHATIVRSIVELGHSLGLRVVAEGLEDARTHHWLQSIGCDAAQGFYLGRPAPASQVDLLSTTPAIAA